LLLTTLAIYIVVLLMVWWFFIVARMHSMKFKNFSTHIEPVTNSLMAFLIFLSLSWFIFIFYINSGESNYELSTPIDNVKKTEVKQEKNYEEEIIWDDYY